MVSLTRLGIESYVQRQAEIIPAGVNLPDFKYAEGVAYVELIVESNVMEPAGRLPIDLPIQAA